MLAELTPAGKLEVVRREQRRAPVIMTPSCGSNVRRAVLRVVVGGALGLAFTYGIGRLFGTAVH